MGTWDWNLVTNQLTWDVGCKAMFGLPPEAEISIDLFFEALHPEDRARLEQIVQQSLEPSGSGSYDTEYRTIGIQDGVERWVKATGQAYFDQTGSPLRFVGVVLDITEQKQIEGQRAQLLQQEQAAREAAESANRIKDEFLAILSHELRSPLNPILGWANLLQTKKMSAEVTARALETIERNAKLQTQLIDDLLDVARILRGKLKLEMTAVDPVFVIEAALETVRSAADVKAITIQVDLQSVGQVHGDAGRLQQIVWNLLTNAVKFTPEGGQVSIQLVQIDHWAQIQVTDTGMGIHPDFLPHIFESFRQEDTSVTRQHGGLGLGLAIVRYLVEAHGGTITADSPGERQGATFTISLPLLSPAPTPTASSPRIPNEIDLTGIRVLVVDDSPDTLEVLTISLEEYGAEVSAFNKAADVLGVLATFRPDILICDIGMPDLDGYTLIKRIRALPTDQAQIPAIALTAYVRDEERRKALSQGFQRHVAKPFDLRQLVILIAELY
jgi:PAS domain S-box-containing protein